MAEINAEEALAHAETMLNWMRSLRYLEETCRFVRGSQNALPVLRQQVQEAEERRAKAEALTGAAEETSREQIAGFSQDVRVARENASREVQAVKQEILGQRQVMEQERERFREETEALHVEHAGLKDALSREADVLRKRIGDLTTELDALKQRAASL